MASRVILLIFLTTSFGTCFSKPSTDFTSNIKNFKAQNEAQKAELMEIKTKYSALESEVGELMAALEFHVQENEEGLQTGDPEKSHKPGPPGPAGPAGPKGPVGRHGMDGRDGLMGAQGPAGSQGAQGPPGFPGAPGRRALYTRWGHTKCGHNSTLVYSGFAGRTMNDHAGGGINYQCMAHDAEQNDPLRTGLGIGDIAGVEYMSEDYGIFPDDAHGQNVPCAVCHTNDRSSVLMIPGKMSCPDNSWNEEYKGYLMSALHDDINPSTFECVDAKPEYAPRGFEEFSTSKFYFNRPQCDHGLDCPPYNQNYVITCVVCSQ